MTGAGRGMDRRAVLRGLGALGLVAGLPACSSPYAGKGLTLATGPKTGNYYKLGLALAQAWHDEVGISTGVAETVGSGANMARLAVGKAQAAISQVDVASDAWTRSAAVRDPRAPRALARIYDDVVHVVVPRESSITTLADLRGRAVSIGDPDSGVHVIAQRVLTAAGLDPDLDGHAQTLDIDKSVAALRTGTIDAFFWSGGLPTGAVSNLAEMRPIRLLDLADVVDRLRDQHPEYAAGTVPVGSYGSTVPTTTLLVRNFLLVGADMADDLAYALVQAMFRRQQQLASALPLALTIDLRRAIGTEPIPLHPGAEHYYQDAKDN